MTCSYVSVETKNGRTQRRGEMLRILKKKKQREAAGKDKKLINEINERWN